MANKISTKSYTVKRLRDSGYNVDKADYIEYKEWDNRKWTIVIDNGCASILFTCFKDGTVQLYDGNRFLSTNHKLGTVSIEVVIEMLNEKGIINKHWNYGKVKVEPEEDTTEE